MNFSEYIKDNSQRITFTDLEDIKDMLVELTPEEFDQLGAVLYTTFFNDDDEFLEDTFFSKEDILDMCDSLGKLSVSIIADLLEYEDEDEDDEAEDDDSLEEGVSRRMKMSNMNKKKRKFMANTKSQMRKTKQERKRNNLRNRLERKRFYKKNRIKVKAYQKSRNDAIDKGKHTVKVRKN